MWDQEERSCLLFLRGKDRPSYRASYKKQFEPGRLLYFCSNIRSQAIFSQRGIKCNQKHTVPIRLFVVSNYLQPARCQFQLLLVFSKKVSCLLQWNNCQFSLPLFPDKSVHHHFATMEMDLFCQTFSLNMKKCANLVSFEAARVQLEVKQVLRASTDSTSPEERDFAVSCS